MSTSLATTEVQRVLDSVDQGKVATIKQHFDIKDTNSIISFGAKAQSKISEFSSQCIDQIKSKDTGYVGEKLTELLMNVKELDVGSLGNDGGILSKIPLLKNLVRSSQKFIAKYDDVGHQIEKIVDELEVAKLNLTKDNILFNQMYEKNLEYLKDLRLYVAAAEEQLKELREEVLPKMKEDSENTDDITAAQRYRDAVEFSNRLEKKVYDLKLTQTLSLQTAPQIRMMQTGNQVLVEKIQSTILNVIPLWKNQIVLAIGMLRSQKAMQLQRKVTDTTNDLIQKNSEMLKQNSLGIAQENERGIVEIESLKKVNTDLIETIDGILRIQQEGRAKRLQGESELVQIERELKTKLLTKQQ
jgi:uncharacterized protein YaaN involved in tellurite resistance